MQRLGAGEELVEVRILRQKADLLAAADLAAVAAEDVRLAARGGDQAEHDFHGRALARAVRPEQAVDLARPPPRAKDRARP